MLKQGLLALLLAAVVYTVAPFVSAQDNRVTTSSQPPLVHRPNTDMVAISIRRSGRADEATEAHLGPTTESLGHFEVRTVTNAEPAIGFLGLAR